MGDLKYMTGFASHFETEALPGALPRGQNSPQKTEYGLYPEQLSGSAFTAPRDHNLRSWFYRITPTVVHGEFEQVAHNEFTGSPWMELPPTPNQLRWFPQKLNGEGKNFLQGLICMAGNGEVGQSGSAIYHLEFDQGMENSFFYSSDSEIVFLPFKNEMQIRTEMGELRVGLCEIAVIPRGVKFQVNPLGGKVSAYMTENFGEPFRLPNLGPIGANGLANPRDFQYPVASFEDKTGEFKLFNKFAGYLYQACLKQSPLDVVAWHGNLAPYKYNLRNFNTINTVSFDHPDPSIFTVLTSPTTAEGTANVDFVIFPPRWMVAENTFRPPYYHRNYMNEYMGLLEGVYDAKAEGFQPGGASLHNRMSGHGPDADTFKKASSGELKPVYQGKTMAFMFESNQIYRPTPKAMKSEQRDKAYQQCWQGIERIFKK